MTMHLDPSDEIASKALKMFQKCLNQSIPTGNLHSGGLGAYYLLLEQSMYHRLMFERQQMLSGKKNNSILTDNRVSSLDGSCNNNRQNTPVRCKLLLKQALEGAQSATDRFKRGKSKNRSYQRSCISLLGGEWVGSHALLAVCHRRLEDCSKMQEKSCDGQNGLPLSLTMRSRRAETENGGNFAKDESSWAASSYEAPKFSSTTTDRSGTSTGVSLFSKRAASNRTSVSLQSEASGEGASMRSEGAKTTVSNNDIQKPKSEQIVDKIFLQLERQHLASDEDDDNKTYHTFGSNYTNNTASSMMVNTIWNQDVLGGRAGALQAIWWLRKEFGDDCLGRELAVSLAVRILEEGLSTAASMGFHNYQDSHDSLVEDHSFNGGSEILFWVCDSHGSYKAYLGAARGVVGILQTLLGLTHEDWEWVEQRISNARRYLRNTIDVFLSTTREGIASDNLSSHPETPPRTNRAVGISAAKRGERSLHERFVFSNLISATDAPDAPDAETKPKFNSGNLRPRMDASPESNTTVAWSHGATGLAMLFLEASKVFRCKEYLREAHRICDTVIFPRGLIEQQRRSDQNGGKANSRMVSMRGGRSVDVSNTSNSRDIRNKVSRKGPVGLASMSICFLQLSNLCSDKEIGDEIETEAKNKENTNLENRKADIPPNSSLKKLWKTRAALYAQHAHNEWENYLKETPITTCSGNAYSLYDGMGGLISLLWQLSLTTFPRPDDTVVNRGESDHLIDFQLPLYGLGFFDYTHANTDLLSFDDVTLSDIPEEHLRQIFPQKFRGTAGAASKQALAESRRRRAVAEAAARRRAAEAEEAERLMEAQAKAERAIQRKTEFESRKKAQLLARKKALDVARRRKDEESRQEENATKTEIEEKSKREALLLARKEAKERVESRRKAKEQEELAKAEAEAQRLALAAEKKRKAKEEEAKKRKALTEARLRRKQKEAEWAEQRELEQKKKDEIDRLRRARELKEKEEARKQRLAKLRLRQLKAAHIAREKEEERARQEAAEREKVQKELKLKEEERKRQDVLRKRRLKLLTEKQKKEEKALAKKKAEEEVLKIAAVRKDAKERRLLELREERLQRKKKIEDERLRRELQRALDKEVEKQRREQRLRRKGPEERKMKVPPPPPPPKISPSPSLVYSPSFVEKKTINPAHFTVPTKSSLFWSLQTDSNIGTSDDYKPALIAADSHPLSEQYTQEEPNDTKAPSLLLVPTDSHPLNEKHVHEETNGSKILFSSHSSSLSSSPAPVNISASPCKPVLMSGFSSQTASTEPSSAVAQQNATNI